MCQRPRKGDSGFRFDFAIRRSHIDDFNFDEALGLFAGLNTLPKKSYATAYSYPTFRL